MNGGVGADAGSAGGTQGHHGAPVFDRRILAQQPQRIDDDSNLSTGVLGKELRVGRFNGLAAGEDASRVVDVLAVLGPQRRDRLGVSLIEGSHKCLRPGANRVEVRRRFTAFGRLFGARRLRPGLLGETKAAPQITVRRATTVDCLMVRSLGLIRRVSGVTAKRRVPVSRGVRVDLCRRIVSVFRNSWTIYQMPTGTQAQHPPPREGLGPNYSCRVGRGRARSWWAYVSRRDLIFRSGSHLGSAQATKGPPPPRLA